MVNETVLLIETELAIPITCADDTGIEKGAVLKMADPATVSLSNGQDDIVGGIAKSEKISGDGFVKTNVYRRGIFKGTASGSITVGDSLGTGIGSNYLYSNKNTSRLSGSRVVGIAWESATDEQTFIFELNPQCIFTD